MTKNSILRKLLILIATLIAVTAVFTLIGCNTSENKNDTTPPTGDETNGESNNTQNGENNDTGEPLLPNIDCGHTLNKYGFCGTCQVDMSFVTVAIGKDITLEYHIVIHDPELIEDKALQVVINDGDHVEVITDLVPEETGYVFKYHGIAPHQMAHRVDAALMIVDGNSLTVIDDILNYTVKENIAEMLAENADNEEIVQVLSDILRYGAAAQLYHNYETDNLATDGIEGLAPERDDSIG